MNPDEVRADADILEQINDLRRQLQDIQDVSRLTQENPSLSQSTPNVQGQNVSESTVDYAEIAKRVAMGFAEVFSTNFRADRPPASTFAGTASEDPEKFLQDMEAYFRNRNILDEREKMQIVLEQLRGEAKQWGAQYKRLQLPYPRFANRLRYKFNATTQLAEARMQLHSEQQTEEPCEIFITRKWILFDRVDPTATEREKAAIVIEQLKPGIKSRIRRRFFDDVEEFIKVASQVESDYEQEKSVLLEELRRERPSTARNRNEHTVRDDNRNTETRNPFSRRPPRECRYCNEWHYHNECPENPYRRSGNAQAGPPRSSRRELDEPEQH